MAGLIILGAGNSDKTWSSTNLVFWALLDQEIDAIDAETAVIHELTIGRHCQCLDLHALAETMPEQRMQILATYRNA